MTTRLTKNQAWQDRRVIVAGGTAGFGLVLARHLARAGARVLIVGRSSDGVRRALDTCDRAGESLDALHGAAAELGRAGEGNRIAGEALDRLGGVDDLFCCVGRSGRAPILDTSDDELRDYLGANLFAATELVRAVADDVVAARGHVVFIGSLFTTALGIAAVLGMAPDAGRPGFVLMIAAWLWLTVLFANFAEAMAG